MRRPLAAILIVLGLMSVVVAPSLFPADECWKVKVDAAGRQVVGADGRPVYVLDEWGTLRLDGPMYAAMSLGVGCVVVGVVLLAIPKGSRGPGFEVVLGKRPRT